MTARQADKPPAAYRPRPERAAGNSAPGKHDPGGEIDNSKNDATVGTLGVHTGK